MPKINVYLPDDLADAVREARIPVSSVCQRALADALRQATAATEDTRAFDDDDDDDEDEAGPMRNRATPRLRAVVRLARVMAADRRAPVVGTEHLVLGMLEEGQNLAVRVIETLDIDLADLRTEIDAEIDAAGRPAGKARRRPKLSPDSRSAFVLAVQESIRLGHNYIGCEHLLLGIIQEDDGLGGRVLRSLGMDKTVTRRAVVSALSGFVQARDEFAARPRGGDDREMLRQILDRLDRLEQRLAG